MASYKMLDFDCKKKNLKIPDNIMQWVAAFLNDTNQLV